MDGEMRGTAAKRGLPAESCGGHVTKRRREVTKSDSCDLLSEEKNGSSDGSCAEDSSEDESSQDIDGNSETSSSGSELDNISEEMTSNYGDEASSTPSVLSSSVQTDGAHEEFEQIQNLPLPKKPSISTIGLASDLRSRLSTFIPELQKANADLQNSEAALSRRLDEVDDDEEHYIEMSLGLGVLKEKSGRAKADGVRLTEDDDTHSDEDCYSESTKAAEQSDERQIETASLVDLLGDKQAGGKQPSIEEIPGS